MLFLDDVGPVLLLLRLFGVPAPRTTRSVCLGRVWPLLYVFLVIGFLLFVVFWFVSFLFEGVAQDDPAYVPSAATPSPLFLQMLLIIVLIVFGTWMSMLAICTGLEMFRSDLLAELLESVRDQPAVAERVKANARRVSRAALIVTGAFVVLQAAGAAIGAVRTDAAGVTFAIVGSVGLFLITGNVLSVAVLHTIACEICAALLQALKRTVRDRQQSLHYVRHAQRTIAAHVGNTSSATQHFVFAVVAAVPSMLVLYCTAVMQVPDSTALARGVFFAPLAVLAITCGTLLRNGALVDRRATRCAELMCTHFLDEPPEVRHSVALYSMSDDSACTVYGARLRRSHFWFFVACMAVLFVFVAQRLLAGVLYL